MSFRSIDLKYPIDLLNLYSKNIIVAIFVSNLLAPLLYVYWRYDILSHQFLYLLLSVHVLLLIVRFIVARKLDLTSPKVIWYNIITTWLSGLVWAVSIVVFAQNSTIVDFAYFSLLLLFLISGAITTIAVLYIGFIGFVGLIFSSLLYSTVVYVDVESYIAFIVLLMYMIFMLYSGYQYYAKMKSMVDTKDKTNYFNKYLKDEVAKQTQAIVTLNRDLEKRITIEVEKNRKKDKHMLHQSRLAQMGEMISMIAHQWRQPLNAVGLIVQDLEDAKRHDVLTDKYLNDAVLQAMELIQYMSKTIDDFRNFYNPNKEKQKILVSKVLDSALAMYQPYIQEKNIKIIKEYDSDKFIALYESELLQVFLNILKNADDNFIEKNISSPYLKIKIYDTDLGVSIEICDNGKGIGSAIIDKVFDPYFSTKQNKNGTGLGLYMSKTIIEEHHGGKMIAKNSKTGACFILTLNTQ